MCNLISHLTPPLSPLSCSDFQAGRRAVQRVYGVEPDLTREGGSIPITLTFEQATKKNVLLLPMGCSDDGAHSQNEKINRVNYINGGISVRSTIKSHSPHLALAGIKLLGAYLEEVAQVTVQQ